MQYKHVTIHLYKIYVCINKCPPYEKKQDCATLLPKSSTPQLHRFSKLLLMQVNGLITSWRFSTVETPGNRFGWFRWGFSLGKRRGEKGVFSVFSFRLSLCRVKPARNLEILWGNKNNAWKKPSWVWLCNKVLGWWHISGKSPWTKMKQGPWCLRQMKALKQRDIIMQIKYL